MSHAAHLLALVAYGALLLACGCGSGCPLPGSPPDEQAQWERWMESKDVLALDPSGDIAIKRDVHNLVVSVSAADFATSFHAVVRDPDRRFGLIQVNRFADRTGEPFQAGERFQGRYIIPDALEEDWKRISAKIEEDEELRLFVCRIENKHTSDFGQIVELQLEPSADRPARFSYRYLEGSPIAGSSTFIVEQLGPERSRVRQVFVYQEQSRSFARFFSRVGLQLHNQVVYSQVRQSAEHAGGRILESDIPEEYRDL